MLKVKDTVKLEDLKKFGFSDNWTHTHINYCANLGDAYVEVDAKTRVITVTIDSDYESSVEIDNGTLEELYNFFNSGMLEVVAGN
jgi:hypothetical protein